MSKTFLSILTVANMTDFCTILTFNLIRAKCVQPSTEALANAPEISYNQWYKPFKEKIYIYIFFVEKI